MTLVKDVNAYCIVNVAHIFQGGAKATNSLALLAGRVTGSAIVVDPLRLVLMVIEFLRHDAPADVGAPAGRKRHQVGPRLGG